MKGKNILIIPETVCCLIIHQYVSTSILHKLIRKEMKTRYMTT